LPRSEPYTRRLEAILLLYMYGITLTNLTVDNVRYQLN